MVAANRKLLIILSNWVKFVRNEDDDGGEHEQDAADVLRIWDDCSQGT